MPLGPILSCFFWCSVAGTGRLLRALAFTPLPAASAPTPHSSSNQLRPPLGTRLGMAKLVLRETGCGTVMAVLMAVLVSAGCGMLHVLGPPSPEALVGKWTASSPFPNDPVGPDRVLVIDSVKQTGAGWVVIARYAAPSVDWEPYRVDAKLEVIGREIVLRFRTGYPSNVELRMITAQWLSGTLAKGRIDFQKQPPGDERPDLTASAGYGSSVKDILDALQKGEGRQALDFYEREAAALERRGRSAAAVVAYTAATDMGWRLGAYQRALRSGHRALEILDGLAAAPASPTGRLGIYADLGITHMLVGDLRQARRFFEDGLALAPKFGSPYGTRFWAAFFLENLGRLDYMEGDYAGALKRSEEARGFLEAQLTDRPSPSENRRLFFVRLLVGDSRARLGDWGSAEVSYREALNIARLLRHQDLEMYALYNLGWISVGRADYSRAATLFEEALSIATRLDHYFRAWAYGGLSRAYARQGRLEEALTTVRHALDLIEATRGDLRDAGLRSVYLEDKQAFYQGAVGLALALGKPEEAFTYAERARARAFLDILGTRTALSKGNTRALLEEEVNLRARLSEAQLSARGVPDATAPLAAREKLEVAERAYRDFLDRVRRDNAEQASLMSVEPISVREVQRLLPEGTTLLEYLLTGEVSVVWVISHDNVKVIRLFTGTYLTKEIHALRGAIAERAPMDRIEELARGLYKEVFIEARSLIRGERLLIVPHGALHYVPFAALLSPEGRWLGEEYTVTTLPSASVLKYLEGKGEGVNERALVLGNPDLGPALNLRYAELEARSIGERYPAATVLVGKEATERQVKALGGQMGLLHFATHAELNETDPLGSALLLVPEAPDDGRLEVREIFGLDLRARLVVLSACETGLGKLSNGDELVGLQRAFLYAGTPAVLTTLWKVDDRASYLLMKEFYKYLDIRGPAEALRQAQRAIMQDFPHPFFWAAFSLTGGPR